VPDSACRRMRIYLALQHTLPAARRRRRGHQHSQLNRPHSALRPLSPPPVNKSVLAALCVMSTVPHTSRATSSRRSRSRPVTTLPCHRSICIRDDMTRTRSARSQLTVNASTTFINVLIERLFNNKRTPHRRQHSVRSLNRSAPQAPLV
jgi:hypothetical protein